MDETVLAKYRKRYNQFALLKTAGWLVVAIPAWLASWWAVRFALAIILGPDRAGWIACAVTPLLFFEAYRYGKDALERETLLDALYYAPNPRSDVQPRRPNPFRWEGRMSPLSQAYLVDILLIAPRSTVRAWQAFRSIVRMDEKVSQSCEAVVAELARDDKWALAEQFRQHVDALRPLEKLGVLRHRIEDGKVMIRLDSDFLAELNGGKPDMPF